MKLGDIVLTDPHTKSSIHGKRIVFMESGVIGLADENDNGKVIFYLKKDFLKKFKVVH